MPEIEEKEEKKEDEVAEKDTATIESEILSDPELSTADFSRLRADQAYMDELVEKRKAAPPAEKEEEKGEKEEEKEQEKEEEEEKEKKGGKKSRGGRGGYKRMAEKMQDKVDQAELKIAALEKRLEAGNPPPGKSKAKVPEKPKEDDFESHIEYIEALTDWKVDIRVGKAMEDKDKKDAGVAAGYRQQQENQNLEQALHTQASAAMKNHEDYAEVVSETDGIEWSDGHRHALAMTGAFGEIAYHLGKNIEEAERLSKIDNLPSLMLELGKITAIIDKEKPEKEEVKEEVKKEVEAEGAIKKKLPAPMKKHVSGKTETEVKDAEYWSTKASPAEYRKARAEGRA